MMMGTLAEAGWMGRLWFRATGLSPFARESDRVFMIILWLSVFFFVLLMGMMVVFVWKYRRRAGVAPPRSPSHNTLLELSWSVIPTILLVWIFFEGFWGFADAVVAPGDSQVLELTASKWQWSVTYPNGAQSPVSTGARSFDFEGKPRAVQDSPVFVVPAGAPVMFRMSSIDVIHSFWIPDFRMKFDVFPNRYTTMWIEADEGQIGDHWVFCAEYCGDLHSDMYAVIRVVPMEQYLATIKDWAEPKGTPAEIGKALWSLKGCKACHSIDGAKNTGPTWKNMYGYAVEFTDGTSMSEADMTGESFANYVRESVFDPGKRVVKGFPNQMTSYQGQLNLKQLNAIIRFMESPEMTDKAPPPVEGEPPAGDQPAGDQPAGGEQK